VIVWNVGSNTTVDTTSHRHVQICWEDAKERNHLRDLRVGGKIYSSKRWTSTLQYCSLDL